MKNTLLIALAALPVLLTSCATPPPPPQAYHATDGSALVIQSIDGQTCRIVQPTASDKIANDQLLTTAKKLQSRQTAVVIMENYTEPQIGDQFRDRGTPWFVGLRTIGYKHIVFVQGNGSINPDGLITLAKYD